MKVTRFKQGYGIRLSDAEFGVLFAAVGNGLGDEPEEICCNETAAERRAWSDLGRLDAFSVDDDRRDKRDQ